MNKEVYDTFLKPLELKNLELEKDFLQELIMEIGIITSLLDEQMKVVFS